MKDEEYRNAKNKVKEMSSEDVTALIETLSVTFAARMLISDLSYHYPLKMDYSEERWNFLKTQETPLPTDPGMYSIQ